MNILLTGYYFNGFHGSMMHINEIGKYFAQKGDKVYCASVIVEEKIKRYSASNGVLVYKVDDLPLDIEYDIVFAYHFPILPYLIDKGLKYKKIVLGCLSASLKIEAPIWFYKNCNLLTSVSQEAKDKMVERYNIVADDIMVLNNFLPDEFYEYKKQKISCLKKIAVVSNHPPKEVVNLKIKGVKIDYWGGNGRTGAITPEILSNYDLVITIGKTVQYALGMGIPVYNYDIFGGSGYILPENFEWEEKTNYSGRSFRRKVAAEEMAKEILHGFDNAVANIDIMKDIASKRYLLSNQLDNILDILSKQADASVVFDEDRLLFNYCSWSMENNILILRKSQRKLKQYKNWIFILLSALIVALFISVLSYLS